MIDWICFLFKFEDILLVKNKNIKNKIKGERIFF